MYTRFHPSEYVLRYRKGKLIQKGQGLSFCYRARSTSACAVPVTGIDADFMFSQTTSDFQTAAVQGQLSYRFSDFEKAAASLDFTVNLKTHVYLDNPLPKASKRIIQENELQTRRMVIEQENDLKRMAAGGELERAHLKLDEEVAMEKTRVGSELERKHMLLDGEIALEEKRRTLAELRLENAKKDADAEAYRIRSVMEAYNTLSADVLIALATMDMDPNKLIARAFEKLAAGSNIGTLNITPDLLESLGKKAG